MKWPQPSGGWAHWPAQWRKTFIHEEYLPAALSLAWFLVLVVRCAWQCDDAYITFRTAENLCHGLGAVWNPDQRVQSYTSPLWMLVATVCRLLTGDVYFSVLSVSIFLTAWTTWLIVFRIGRDHTLAAIAVMVMSTSAAISDYSTSGLENPLLFLLLVQMYIASQVQDSSRRVLRLSWVGSLLLLTRLDAVIFWLPSMVAALVAGRGKPRMARQFLVGLSPFLAWEAFSLIYYGSLIPNTAYAKLNLAIPVSTLALQGGRYLLDAARFDPVTVLLILSGLLVAFVCVRAASRALSVAVALYLVYLVRIGGDFMSGRLLAAPAILCTLVLLSAFGSRVIAGYRRLFLVALLVCICAYGTLWPQSNWLSGRQFGTDWKSERVFRDAGIANERAYYYPSTGLLPVLARWKEIRRDHLPVPPYDGASMGADFSRGADQVTIWAEVGYFGYFAGPRKTIIDTFGLCDPLLARLPYRPQPGWRIGHFDRKIPAGYQQALLQNSDRLSDRRLAGYYRAIRTLIHGPLFTRERWREIWRFNTGYYLRLWKKAEYY